MTEPAEAGKTPGTEDRPEQRQAKSEPRKTLRERLSAAHRWLGPRYLRLDVRTLGLFRIAIGTLLCLNCVRVWQDLRLYYSNDGVLSNHWHLFRPSSEFGFSLFHAFSTPSQVHVAFAAAFTCFFLFAIGYQTRLFNALSLIWITSLDNRLVLVENGGYVVVNLAVFWALFLPVGARFSVDRLREAWRRAPRTIAELSSFEAPADLHHSLASLLLILNFATIYIFNVVNKYGSTWRSGETVHYVLHLDRLATPVAAWLREALPFWATRGMTWSVLVVEALIVMLISWPVGRRWSRPLAMLLIAGLHTSFGVMMQLGPFSWFMIGWSTALICTVHWEAMARQWRRWHSPIEVAVSPRSGVAGGLARLLAIADGPGCLRFTEKDSEALFEVTRDGITLEGRRAFWVAAGATPAGIPLRLLRALSLGLLDATLAWALSPTGRADRFLGMAAARSPSPPVVPPAASPLRQGLHRWLVRGREVVVVFFVCLFVSQLINENKSIPELLKHELPKGLRAFVVYPRLFQGWGMFAPNPIRQDGVLAIDAITVEGRHVDPLRGRAPDLNLSDDRSCGLNQIHQDYGNRIRQDRNKAHRQSLERFLKRYHEVTGNPDDRLVYYAVYWLRDECPKPGSLEPTNHEKICLASWRKRGHRAGEGQEPLPPPCKVQSAEDD